MTSFNVNFSEFEGKKILITGASTGIGAELAKAFAQQGARVGLHYFSSEGKGLPSVKSIISSSSVSNE